MPKGGPTSNDHDLTDTATNAVLEQKRIEVQQQPDLATADTQIGLKLSLVYRQDVFDRFSSSNTAFATITSARYPRSNSMPS